MDTATHTRQFSCKLPAGAGELFNELYDQARRERPALTRGAFLEDILRQAASPAPAPAADGGTLRAERDNLQAELGTLRAEHAGLQAERDTLLAERDGLAARCADLEQARDTLSAELEAAVRQAADERPAPGTIAIAPPQPHRALLEETCRRLAASPADVLLDMFIRYTVEQRAEWFYPFVIREADFPRLTGHNRNTLQKWIKKNDRRKP